MMKTVFITGISRGLGLKLTEYYLSEGYRVLGVSRTKTIELESLLGKYPSMLLWHQLDLSEVDVLEERLAKILALVEKIDIFIDNAAILYKDLVHRIKKPELAKMFAINTIAPIVVTKVVINNFLSHKTKGVIVHISSICAHRSFNGLSMIGATKAAMETFSKDTAYEYGRFGIRSNTVVLGLLEIGMKSTVNDRLTEGLKSIAAQKRLIDAQSAVDAIAFLTSEKSNCITGANIHVNAGIL